MRWWRGFQDGERGRDRIGSADIERMQSRTHRSEREWQRLVGGLEDVITIIEVKYRVVNDNVKN